MKTRIVLIFAMLSLSAGVMAQTVYYQTDTTYDVSDAFSVRTSDEPIIFKSDVDTNNGVTLYNSRNRFTYEEWPKKPNGLPLDPEFWLGEKRMFRIEPAFDHEINRRMNMVIDLIWQELMEEHPYDYDLLLTPLNDAIKDRTFGVHLYFDPATGMPIEVKFRFRNSSPFKYVHPNFFRRIEYCLVELGGYLGLTINPEVRTVNYVRLIWRQKLERR